MSLYRCQDTFAGSFVFRIIVTADRIRGASGATLPTAVSFPSALRNNDKIHHLNVGNGLDHSAMLFDFRQYRHKRNAQERSLQNTTHIHRSDLNRKIINYQLSIINFKKDVVS